MSERKPVTVQVGTGAKGAYEPSLLFQFQPRCRACGAAHPKAQGVDSQTCPQCGYAVPPLAEPVRVAAVVTDWHIWWGGMLFKIGLFLGRVAKKWGA